MGLSVVASGRPVFLLGTGRCGSTFWQTLLCRAEGLWVWGEHAGILRNLLRARRDLATSPHFPAPPVPPLGPEDTAAPGAEEGMRMAWNNGFRGPDLDDELRGLVDGLMQRRLPAGKSRWGFKEIRYGDPMIDGADEVPRHLLELFPGAIAVLTLRHPRATIESSLGTFNPQVMAGAGAPLDLAALRREYVKHARRWRRVVNELLDLESDHEGRVVTVRIEDVSTGRATLAAALDVRLPGDHPVINAAPRPGADQPAIRAALAALWSSGRPRLAGTMRRAGYSDADSD